jgi:hypothetical protein
MLGVIPGLRLNELIQRSLDPANEIRNPLLIDGYVLTRSGTQKLKVPSGGLIKLTSLMKDRVTNDSQVTKKGDLEVIHFSETSRSGETTAILGLPQLVYEDYKNLRQANVVTAIWAIPFLEFTLRRLVEQNVLRIHRRTLRHEECRVIRCTRARLSLLDGLHIGVESHRCVEVEPVELVDAINKLLDRVLKRCAIQMRDRLSVGGCAA